MTPDDRSKHSKWLEGQREMFPIYKIRDWPFELGYSVIVHAHYLICQVSEGVLR